MGYRGCILSDDMEMGAVTKNFEFGEACVRALKAGVDLLMVCHSESRQLEAIQAICSAVMSGELERERLVTATERVSSLLTEYASLPPVPLRVCGSREHRETIKAILSPLREPNDLG